MFEYKATVVGPLNRLRPGQRKVEEVNTSLAGAYEAALAHYSKQGYRLHSVAHIEGALVLFVFEKYILEYPADITDPDYGKDTYTCKEVSGICSSPDYINPHDYQYRGRCRCHNPQVAETEGGESA